METRGFQLLRSVLLDRGEKSVVSTLRMLVEADGGAAFVDFGVPEFSHLEVEFPLRRGRADLVAFHDDGTATIIEAKDGGCGLRDVVAGIGQLVSYSVQMGMSTGAPTAVRKALAFSSTGSEQDDEIIAQSCRAAGVTAIQLPHVKETKALYKLMLMARVLAERTERARV